MKGSKSYSIVLHMIIIMPKQPKNIRYPAQKATPIYPNILATLFFSYIGCRLEASRPCLRNSLNIIILLVCYKMFI